MAKRKGYGTKEQKSQKIVHKIYKYIHIHTHTHIVLGAELKQKVVSKAYSCN